MTNEIEYRIKIKKGNIEIEVQGDKVWVEAKFKELSDEIKSTKPIGPTPPIPTPTGLPDSITELIKLKGSPKRHTDRSMVFSYWLTKVKRMSSYHSGDIEQCYLDALIAKPTNTNDVMNANQKKAYLIQTPNKDGKKAWRISLSGEKYVEEMKE